MIKLITRGDDSGSAQSANKAILDAYVHGNLKSTSIMVPTPHYAEAVSLFKDHSEFEIGLHATITDEWDAPRWGPVLPAADVSSLVYDDATFFTDCVQLWERYGGDEQDQRPSNDEIMNEISAQLDTVRQDGLHIAYLDTHMGFDWFHGLSERLQEFCKAEGIIYGNAMDQISPIPQVEGEFDTPVDQLIDRLAYQIHPRLVES
ncbi:MAG: ChbG/HpnK family deacetylase, partial [Lentisphaeria bacterium]|nr:ChbG/HpnK family deacetylase [Lentisphaeria bacterium]